MKNMIAAASAALLIAGLSAAPAFAKHRVHKPAHATAGTTGMARGNAALGGNNGNSAGGSNSATNPNNPGSTGSGM